MIDLFLFENDADAAAAALPCGIRHFLIDWEDAGKPERQKGFDTEIRPGTLADLSACAKVDGATAWCRVNGFSKDTAREVEAAIGGGAAGIFLPMVTSVGEVEDFLDLIGGRCAAGILIETPQACTVAAGLAALPIDRVYFGLNDFAICRGHRSIFHALLDGTVEHVAGIMAAAGTPFGFGGLTVLEGGFPVPSRLLLHEMVRLGCGFTFLRRSFRRDTRDRDRAGVVGDIQGAWADSQKRDSRQIAADHAALVEALHAVC